MVACVFQVIDWYQDELIDSYSIQKIFKELCFWEDLLDFGQLF